MGFFITIGGGGVGYSQFPAWSVITTCTLFPIMTILINGCVGVIPQYFQALFGKGVFINVSAWLTPRTFIFEQFVIFVGHSTFYF